MQRSLGVNPGFFFEAVADQGSSGLVSAPNLETNAVTQFISSKEGLALNRAFINIKSPRLRQQIVALAKAAAESDVNEFVKEEAVAVVNDLHSS